MERTVRNITQVPADAIISKVFRDGSTLLSSPTEGKFVYIREASPQAVKATIDRPANSDHPALRVEVEGKANIAGAMIVVGPVTAEQDRAATRLLAEAEVLSQAAGDMNGNYRLEQAAARKVEQANNLSAGTAARVVADRQTIKMAGRPIDGAPMTVALAKGESGRGRKAEAETVALSDKRGVDKFVRNQALEEALADQRVQPTPGFLGRWAARIHYVAKGGEEPELARVDRLHERFEQVRSQASQRIVEGLENVRRAVLPVQTGGDLQDARAELRGEIAAARQEAAREDARISDWVAADTGHFGNEGGSGGGGGGFAGFFGNLLGGRMESGSYSRESMETLEKYGN